MGLAEWIMYDLLDRLTFVYFLYFNCRFDRTSLLKIFLLISHKFFAKWYKDNLKD